jgi:arsenate reductase
MAGKERILFVCTHNSARSQMAEGLVRHMYGSNYDAFSAGTQPSVVNPYAVRAMAEIGIDISHQLSKGIDEFINDSFDYVITVCDNARETCPFFPNGKMIHKEFRDPSLIQGTEEEIETAFRQSRDEIKKWLELTLGNQKRKKKPAD